MVTWNCIQQEVRDVREIQTAIICTAVVLSTLCPHQAGNTATDGYPSPLSSSATVVIGQSPSLSLRQGREYGVGGG